MNKHQKLIFYIWLIFLGIIFSSYLYYPQFFEADNLKIIFTENIYWAFIIYLILGTLRGFTLLPLTPLLFAGILIFPPIPLFLITITCVFTSSTIVYYWGKYLGFDRYFNKKYPAQMKKLQHALSGKELPIIILWSFFPLVPTDLICYVSEIMRVKLWKCLVGVGIGEGIICAIYIFGSNEIIAFFSL